jgi:beta-glucosidase
MLDLVESRRISNMSSVSIWPEATVPVATSEPIENEMQQLLSRMSLEQKVGQLIQPDIRYITPGEAAEYYIGSVLSGGGAPPHENRYATPKDWVELADEFYKASFNGGAALPIMWGVDAVHGHNNLFGATLFPHNVGIGASRNSDLVRQIAEISAIELAISGIKWTFAPTLAVARDDRWGRTYESYSEDPCLVAQFATRNVEGYQGVPGTQAYLADGRVLATAKHFLGDGGTAGGIDQGNTVCDEKSLFAVHGKPYVDALRAGAQVVMASFSSWNGLKLHGHRYLLMDVLKSQMGFDGFVISDWNGHAQLPAASNDYGVVAINCGIDMLMAPEDWRQLWHNTIEHVQDGLISSERLDDAVGRILRVKLRAGIRFGRMPSENAYSNRSELLGCSAHRNVARQAVRESLVLLKNRDNVLPLNERGNYLLLGPGGDSIPMQCGGWSLTWQGDNTRNIDYPNGDSLASALRTHLEASGGKLTSVETLDDDSDLSGFDAVIVAFGEQPYAEGHGDRIHLSYSSNEPGPLQLLRRLKTAGLPIISVFLTGRPLWVNPELNASDAFVVAWLPGTEAAGISDLIFSNSQFDFKGKLPFSWPATPYQTPLNLGDKDYRPLFPYGFGLTLGDKDELSDNLSEHDATHDVHHYKGLGIFSLGPVAPFQLYVGDEHDWRIPVEKRVCASGKGVVEVQTIDWQRQEDARRVRWHGGSGQVFFSSNEAVDCSRYFSRSTALVFSACLHVKPERLVKIRLDSGYPEGTELDITGLFGNLPLNDWQTLTIPLSGLSGDGIDATRITTPFLLWTDGLFDISIAEISIEV